MNAEVLLRNPRAYIEGRNSVFRSNRLAKLVLLVMATSFVYGASVGAYSGGEQVLFAAVKMPILFMGTLLIGFPIFYIFASGFIGISAGFLFEITLFSVAVTTTFLAAFAPIQFVCSMSIPNPSYPCYLFLVLFMVFLIALSGTVGVVQLYRALLPVATDKKRLFKLVITWFLIYQFIGAQMSWLLRPFVGSPWEIKGGFFIWRYFEGNIYEAVFRATGNLFKHSF